MIRRFHYECWDNDRFFGVMANWEIFHISRRKGGKTFTNHLLLQNNVVEKNVEKIFLQKLT